MCHYFASPVTALKQLQQEPRAGLIAQTEEDTLTGTIDHQIKTESIHTFTIYSTQSDLLFYYVRCWITKCYCSYGYYFHGLSHCFLPYTQLYSTQQFLTVEAMLSTSLESLEESKHYVRPTQDGSLDLMLYCPF